MKIKVDKNDKHDNNVSPKKQQPWRPVLQGTASDASPRATHDDGVVTLHRNRWPQAVGNSDRGVQYSEAPPRTRLQALRIPSPRRKIHKSHQPVKAVDSSLSGESHDDGVVTLHRNRWPQAVGNIDRGVQ